MNKQEFEGVGAELYEQAMTKYPLAREEDIQAMFRHLAPQQGDKIIGFGEGNGYFCSSIAQAIGSEGRYLVTDPSQDQLDNLVRRVCLPQIEVRRAGIEELNLKSGYFDKAWSFGAFHHCTNQTEAMKRIYGALRNGGSLVLCDVFQGSPLASHFDEIVARYCLTGHDVKFLSDGFAKTLCYLAGFSEKDVTCVDLPQKWKFQSENDLGEFIYKLHALTKLPGTEEEKIGKTLESCRKILGIEYKNGCYELNWPMKAIIAIK